MKYQYAPIAFFAYKRPDKTLQSLTSLANNPEAQASELFIFCDGPKAPQDQAAVLQTRDVARHHQWCGRTHIIEQTTNQGLARSVISGVTQLAEEFERVIVLEDDLLVSRGFLSYMNRALEKYATEERIFQISGHMFPILDLIGDDDAFLMPMVTSWGWATWRRAWRFFDQQATGYDSLKQDEDLRNKFDLDGSYPYTAMLLAQMAGRIDSWAIRWWWSVFKNHGLSLYPKVSLIKNIGFSSAATNTKGSNLYFNDLRWSEQNGVISLPNEVEVNQHNFRQVQRCLSLAVQIPMLDKMRQRIKALASYCAERMKV